MYHEPARTYASTVALLALLVAGFVLDLALGGGKAHLVAWLIAAVIVVGADLLVVHAARSLHSVTVTASDLRVGEESVARADIIGFEQRAEVGVPVLGRSPGSGLPRGTVGLTIHLSDGRVFIVATRHPHRLARALEVALQVPDVRVAEPADAAATREVWARAQALFRVAGLDLPATWSSTTGLHEIKAELVSGRPATGFIRLGEVDGLANIDLMAVVPGRMRNGVGTALLEAACNWAEAHGYRAITVTTYADVGWNAPFFAARGFVPCDPPGPEMVELRDWERAVGLDSVGPRLVMRRELAP